MCPHLPQPSASSPTSFWSLRYRSTAIHRAEESDRRTSLAFKLLLLMVFILFYSSFFRETSAWDGVLQAAGKASSHASHGREPFCRSIRRFDSFPCSITKTVARIEPVSGRSPMPDDAGTPTCNHFDIIVPSTVGSHGSALNAVWADHPKPSSSISSLTQPLSTQFLRD
ncbi:hypothetical protein CIHG_06288 [Coccidioides immitis H538.4]|uniref:Uncharacterized protein n=2 Tax=Coccidioides immitis TaxID=5501 RepID=A0A0J8ULQ5_COCIT|nr:hypothetical protein CIRG_09569 [Coccidioides immitis RMSCC 2394]KMU88488.1 hypothetical protein CIHG_06288 [Coccidioides immitis H538.4]